MSKLITSVLMFSAFACSSVVIASTTLSVGNDNCGSSKPIVSVGKDNCGSSKPSVGRDNSGSSKPAVSVENMRIAQNTTGDDCGCKKPLI